MRKYKLNALCRERMRFPANISCFPRRLQDVLAIRLPKTSSRCLQDVFKAFSRHLQDVFQDVFKTSSKTSSRHLQDVFKTSLQDVLQLCLQDVLSTSSPRRIFAGLLITTLVKKKKHCKNNTKQLNILIFSVVLQSE